MKQQVHRQRPNFPHLYQCGCGKAYAATKDEARRIRKEMEDLTGHHDEVRFYVCDRGSWHWTRRIDRRTA